MNRLLTTLAFTGLLISSIRAEGDSIEVSRPVLTVSQEITRVVKGGTYINSLGGLDNAWIMPTSGSIDFQVKMNSHAALEVMLAGIYFAAPYHYDFAQNFTRNLALSAPRLDASYAFGADPAHPFLKVDAGIWGYKYNEYSRDLGEYMFRTWAYPGIIMTGGTYNYTGNNSATVTGVKLSQTFGIFSHDLIASIETDMTPVYDLNLTYMAKANFGNVFKIGAGVQLARAYNANDDSITNNLMNVTYFKYNNTWYAGGQQGSGYYDALIKGAQDKLADTTLSAEAKAKFQGEVDQATLAKSIVDSTLKDGLSGPAPEFKKFSAKAVKPVMYFSFDPKPLIGSSIFGAKDLVLYGEAAILGLHDNPVFYPSLKQRIPMMIGFNIPAFKILDVLSVEGEYYGNRWLPTYDAPNNINAKPVPFMALSGYYASDWDKDNFKWAVSAEKTLAHTFTITGQVASDHARSWDWTSYGKTPWEIYTTPSQYYWSLKLTMKI